MITTMTRSMQGCKAHLQQKHPLNYSKYVQSIEYWSTLSTSSIDALEFTNNITTAKWPHREAICKGVHPAYISVIINTVFKEKNIKLYF